MTTEDELLNRIVINPRIMTGKPIIKGTRIPVEQILKLLAQGLSFNDILKDYPHLKKEDVKAALLYAAKVMGREEVYPITVEWPLLKFLVDESTGIKVSESLKKMGFDSLSVIETMKGTEDINVIKKAKKKTA